MPLSLLFTGGSYDLHDNAQFFNHLTKFQMQINTSGAAVKQSSLVSDTTPALLLLSSVSEIHVQRENANWFVRQDIQLATLAHNTADLVERVGGENVDELL